MVAAVNQAARRAGLQPGLSLSDARAIHPAVLTVPLDRDANTAALRDLAIWLGRYGPNRNVDGEDGLWVEITGVAHLFGGEPSLLEDLELRLSGAGLTVRAAAADTYGAAHALARYGTQPRRPYVLAVAGATSDAVAELPVDALRLTEDSLLLLKRLGLRKIGQVAAIPKAAMARRFRDEARGARRQDREALARAVVWRLDQLTGEIAEPKTPLEPPPHRSRRILFAEPLISSEGIAVAVRDALAGLSEDLAEIGEGALNVRLCLFRADGTVARLDVGVSRPASTPTHLQKLFDVKLPEVDAGLGIDVVLVSALRVAPLETVQPRLRDGQRTTSEPTATADLVDRLSNRLGERNVRCLTTVESHWPERAFRTVAAQTQLQRRARHAPPARVSGERRSDGLGRQGNAELCDVAPRPRPQFLLEPPEPIEVLAALPEGPPARFKWRRRQCRIRRASPPERIAPEWWTDLPARHMRQRGSNETETSIPDVGQGGEVQAEGAPQSASALAASSPKPLRPRDYYVLEDVTGGRFWVFRDGLYHLTDEDDERPPKWFMHGVFA
jgi:protein ImuB